MGACVQRADAAHEIDFGSEASANEQLSTMWVIKVMDVMRLRCPAPCHQDLKAAGKLVPCTPAFFTIFVSHQWLGRRHPDRTGAQLHVLQSSLANIIEGRLRVEQDVHSQLAGHSTTLSAEERARLQDGYIWMDWFSVPQQLEFEQDDEEDCGTSSWTSSNEANLCIASIPAYVEACQIFLALVPSLEHEGGSPVNYSTWLQRGWCRAEMWCKLLSDRSAVPIVVVTDTERAHFEQPMLWLRSPVHSGDFGIDSDREKVNRFIWKALDLKLARLAKRKDLKRFRFFAAKAAFFLGDPTSCRSQKDFLEHFMFDSFQAAVQQRGFTAVHCAVLAGDTCMLKELLQAGASPAARCPGMVEVDISAGATALHLAACGGQRCEKVLEMLLKQKADPRRPDKVGVHPLGFCLTSWAVDLLLQHRADVNGSSTPSNASPLCVACYRLAPPGVIAKLLESQADVHGSGGLGVTPLSLMIFFSHGNPHWKETADLLMDAQADPNKPIQLTGLFRLFQLACQGWLMVRKESPLIVKIAAEANTTPLGLAALIGSDTMMQYLLDAGSQVHIRNNRSKTPMQLASNTRVKERLRAHMMQMREEFGMPQQLSPTGSWNSEAAMTDASLTPGHEIPSQVSKGSLSKIYKETLPEIEYLPNGVMAITF
ncbi:unnamed protein product [Effrenium voratum]|uniref:Uncharacterized protein n=1 Tax=Effrenium voratum TaxID=2562239 RepID=A0AA36N2T3_9DINO|nr:unnamed protein product [Effrenium voratum]